MNSHQLSGAYSSRMPLHSHSILPDWSAFWRFGACWAGRPVMGLILPGSERMKVMLRVMEDFMEAHPALPGEVQTYVFIQSHAVQHALNATRAARLASGQPDLWHDPQHRGTTPVIDLAELQQRENSSRWNDVLTQMRPRALGLLKGQGVDEHDAEDLFAEAIAGMVKPRQNGTAAVHDLIVYEQLPPLFLSIVRRRLVNHIRHRHADKREVGATTSLDDEISGLDDHTFSTWAANAADPMHGLTLARLAQECAHKLTALQQRILSTLYVEESATYMEVANAPWFAQAMNLKSGVSDATRRRALDAQHDGALDLLARALGLSRPQR